MAKKKSAGQAGQIPPPKCKAILLCDQVIVDARTGHYTAVGIFDEFPTVAYPGKTRSFVIYLQLTSGIGSYAITLEILDLTDGTRIASARGPSIHFGDRSAKAHMIIEVPPLRLAHSGVYDFVVLANDQEIDRQQFSAPSPEETEDEQGEAEDPGEG